MQGHIEVGREYPGVDNHTTYSFGLDDQEFVVAFDTDDVGTFLDLVQRLRTTEASRYTVRDTPSFTCIAMSLERALNALDGEPVALESALPALSEARGPPARGLAHLRRADPVLAGSSTRSARCGDARDGPPRPRRPLRRPRARDRRPAALGAGRPGDLRAADRPLRRPPADAAGDPRRRSRRAARRRRPLARQGRLPALARRARPLRRARARAPGRARPTSR